MTKVQQQALSGRPPNRHPLRQLPGVLIAFVVVLTLVATVRQYHAAEVPGVSGVTAWTEGAPEITPRPGVVGGFSILPDGGANGGGVFTFWIPADKTGPQEVTLHLINSDQLARSYRYINMFVSVTPAVEQEGRLAQNAAAFVQAAARAGDGARQVLNPDNGSITFIVDTTDGTPVDRNLNTASSPEYIGSQAYAFNVGISGGSYVAMSAGLELSPTFVLDLGD